MHFLFQSLLGGWGWDENCYTQVKGPRRWQEPAGVPGGAVPGQRMTKAIASLQVQPQLDPEWLPDKMPSQPT